MNEDPGERIAYGVHFQISGPFYFSPAIGYRMAMDRRSGGIQGCPCSVFHPRFPRSMRAVSREFRKPQEIFSKTPAFA
ncbi:MAG: hypothetical protein ACOX5J_15170 [Candidatus Hydrogenedentales bacterium]